MRRAVHGPGPKPRRRGRCPIIGRSIAFFAAAGCQPTPSAEPPTLEILAAASLVDALPPLLDAFERIAPDWRLQTDTGGSHRLGHQLRAGRRADVFMPAHPAELADFREADGWSAPVWYAQNQLSIALSQAASIADLAALPQLERIVLGTPGAPIGVYTERFLRRGQAVYGEGWRRALERRVVSREGNVRRLRARILMGEADAAIVYRSDLIAGHAPALPVPEALSPPIHYAAIARRRPDHAGERWLAFLKSATAQRILQRHGFGAAP